MTRALPELPEPLLLEWDPDKATASVAKHGLPFEVVGAVLMAPEARFAPDRAHSAEEERWHCHGRVDVGRGPRLLVVVFTRRSGRVRIIGVRTCNQREVFADAQERYRIGG